jgi:hypothetical protein
VGEPSIRCNIPWIHSESVGKLETEMSKSVKFDNAPSPSRQAKERDKDTKGDGDEAEGEESQGDETLRVVQDLAKRLREGRRRTRMKVDTRWDQIIRVRNQHLLCFSMIGLAASIALSYYKWAERCWVLDEPDGDCDVAFIGNPNATLTVATVSNTAASMPVANFFIILGQSVITFSTVVCIRVLFQLYRLHLTERRRAWSGLDEIDLINDDSGINSRQTQFKRSYNFLRSSLKWQFLLELLVHVLHPIVWLETAGPSASTLYEVLQSFIFLRLYLVFRVLYINSRIYQHREDIVKSNRELRESGYEVTMTSTAKIVFYKQPTIVVLSMTATSVAVLGFWMFVTERNNNTNFESLWDCYWFVWVSIATIGYGDMYAITRTGRIIVLFIVLASLFITTVFSGIVTNLLSPTREQRLVSSYLAQDSSQKVYREAAAELIVAAIEERKRNRTKSASTLISRRSPMMYAAIKKFRKARLVLRESLGAAADPVMDNKLVTAVTDAHNLNISLDKQAQDIAEIEEALAKAVHIIKTSIKQHGFQKPAPSAPR